MNTGCGKYSGRVLGKLGTNNLLHHTAWPGLYLPRECDRPPSFLIRGYTGRQEAPIGPDSWGNAHYTCVIDTSAAACIGCFLTTVCTKMGKLNHNPCGHALPDSKTILTLATSCWTCAVCNGFAGPTDRFLSTEVHSYSFFFFLKKREYLTKGATPVS